MTVTTKQISQLAGVSRGTVDRVLNNRGKVKPETSQKVWEIANSLGYKPNRIGKALATCKKAINIGVIIMSIGNDFFKDVLKGIDTASKDFYDFGINVIIEKMKGFDVSKQIELINLLEKESVNALAITPINDPIIAERLNELSNKGITIVTLNSDIEGVNRLAYVGSNYIKGGETACGLMGLITKGSANVGIVTGSVKMLGHNQRIKGFNNIKKERFPNIKIMDIVENKDDDFESFEVVKVLLEKHKEINALYLTAAGVYGACRAVKSLGLDKKITIISFDDVENTKHLIKDETISATICQQPEIQGYKAIKVLFDFIVDKIEPENDLIYTHAEIKIKENI